MLRLAPFGFVLLWASSFIASRVGLRLLSPFLFVTVRLILTSVVLLVLRPLQWLGLALGAAGVVLIVGLAALRSPVEFDGLLLTAGGVVGLCSGTLYFGRFCRGVPIFEATTIQMLAATAACAVATLALETPHAEWTEAAVLAVLWNAGAVSLG